MALSNDPWKLQVHLLLCAANIIAGLSCGEGHEGAVTTSHIALQGSLIPSWMPGSFYCCPSFRKGNTHSSIYPHKLKVDLLVGVYLFLHKELWENKEVL